MQDRVALVLSKSGLAWQTQRTCATTPSSVRGHVRSKPKTSEATISSSQYTTPVSHKQKKTHVGPIQYKEVICELADLVSEMVLLKWKEQRLHW